MALRLQFSVTSKALTCPRNKKNKNKDISKSLES